jgi:transcription factor SPT20
LTKQGCLIVELHDHKSITAAKETSQVLTATERIEPFSVHNYNSYVTPSPWVPYPKEDTVISTKKESSTTDEDESRPKTASEKDKENMPAPSQLADSKRNRGAKKAKVQTVVLHPTPLAAYVDLAIKATTPLVVPAGNRRESRVDIGTPISARPQTPLLAMPPTPHIGMEPPAKRAKIEKMELDAKNIHAADAQITLATNAPLFLEPVANAEAAAYLLEALVHPEHSSKMPSPKSRKKTVAEMAAEESATKNEQQFMLTLDDRRLSSINGVSGGANPSDGDGQTGATSWEPRFEGFRAIENIKLQHAEAKRKEKIKQAEDAKRQQQEGEQRAKQQAEAAKMQEEENRRRLQQQQQQQQAAQQQQQQQAQQQAMQQAQMRQEQQRQQQIAAQQARQNQQGMQGSHPQMNQPQVQHAHPTQQNVGVPNGLTAAQQQRFLQQQQFSQGQASSPIVRNATPHNLSSPMVPNTMGMPMQQSTSSMGGSPPRPGSVVQQGAQMTPAMTHAMRAQGSQQSHGGTPRPLNATPNIPQAARQISQTPRMSMASPMPGGMVQVPGGNPQQMMMQNAQANQIQIHQAQQIAAQRQQQAQERMRQQALQQAMGSSPPGFQQMTPQQQLAMQQQMQQMQQNGGNPQAMMTNPQMSANYAAQMRSMAQAQQAAAAMQQGNSQNFISANGMTQQQMLQAQQMQQQHQNQQQMNPRQIQMQQQIRMMSTKFYQAGLQNLNVHWNGNVPPEAMAAYKQQCSQKAQAFVSTQMRAHAMQAQQQQAQQQMGQNVNMMQGMGRPPGM